MRCEQNIVYNKNEKPSYSARPLITNRVIIKKNNISMTSPEPNVYRETKCGRYKWLGKVKVVGVNRWKSQCIFAIWDQSGKQQTAKVTFPINALILLCFRVGFQYFLSVNRFIRTKKKCLQMYLMSPCWFQRIFYEPYFTIHLLSHITNYFIPNSCHLLVSENRVKTCQIHTNQR